MKPFYTSKTFWFNILAGLLAVAGVFGYGGYTPAPDVVEIIGIVVAIVNVALRFVTKEPIGLKK